MSVISSLDTPDLVFFIPNILWFFFNCTKKLFSSSLWRGGAEGIWVGEGGFNFEGYGISWRDRYIGKENTKEYIDKIARVGFQYYFM